MNNKKVLLYEVGVLQAQTQLTCRVGQNRIYTPYINVCMVISLPNIPYIHRIYMVLANPTHTCL